MLTQHTSLLELAKKYAPSFEGVLVCENADTMMITKGDITMVLEKNEDNTTTVLHDNNTVDTWPRFEENLWLYAGGDGRRLVSQLLHRRS